MRSIERGLLVTVFFGFMALLAKGSPHSNLTNVDLCARIDRQIAALNNIIMREEVSRYDSVHGREQKIDDFEASVEISDGIDTVARLRHNGKPYPTSKEIPGAWSFGDFSAVLRISREALETEPVRFVPGFGAEPAALVASFHYPASSARWFVALGSHRWWLDFLGDIRMSAETGDVVDISWASAPLAAEADIRQIQRTIRFAPFEVSGETFVLPEYAEYRVIHLKDRVEWNTTRFSDPARFGSVVSVKFGDE